MAIEAAPVTALHGDGARLSAIELGRWADVGRRRPVSRPTHARSTAQIGWQLGCEPRRGPSGASSGPMRRRPPSVPGVFAAGDITRCRPQRDLGERRWRDGRPGPPPIADLLRLARRSSGRLCPSCADESSCSSPAWRPSRPSSLPAAPRARRPRTQGDRGGRDRQDGRIPCPRRRPRHRQGGTRRDAHVRRHQRREPAADHGRHGLSDHVDHQDGGGDRRSCGWCRTARSTCPLRCNGTCPTFASRTRPRRAR